MKVNLEQLEEMQKELFRQQCDLDIQKAMVKHFIKKEKAEQLTLTDVIVSSCCKGTGFIELPNGEDCYCFCEIGKKQRSQQYKL